MKRAKSQIRPALALIALGALNVLLWSPPVFGLDPSLDVSQYAHTAWKIREGFATGTIHQIAQSPDGYLWLATEVGLLRFDGVRTVPWQPPLGERLPSSDIRSIVAGRDGTLWLGTAKGLVSWKDGKLTEYSELAGRDIFTIYEDRQGVVWASGIQWGTASSPGILCAIKGRDVQCYGGDGKLGFGVFSFYEDSRGNLWLAAGNGLWRWKPGTPQRYRLPAALQSGTSFFYFSRNAICEDDDGRLLIAADRGFGKLANGKIEVYPHPAGMPLRAPATLLRDRDGGLWIGTLDAGILHQHRGKMDAFTDSDGLSGNSLETFFEDREGNMWAATENGIDRFREYAVPTISVRQGLSSPLVVCLLAGQDGSVWMGTSDGLDRWKNGQITVYRRPGKETARQNNGPSNAVVREIPLQDNYIDSLYQDTQGRLWVSTHKGLGYFQNETFLPLTGVPITSAIPVTGDDAGNLWTASSSCGLCRLRDGKVVERLPWASLGLPNPGSNSVVADPTHGGLWLASWNSGVSYFKDGRVRAYWGPAQGLGTGRVTDLKLDADGSVWAATEGGLSRIKDGRVATLTSRNGLPCDNVHDFAEDNTHAFWLYTACGLVRIPRAELDAWGTDPGRTVQTTVFDASDGIRSHAGDYYPAPRIANTADGSVWFLPLDGVSIVDPRRLPLINKLPPPVHIEQITADGKVYTPAAGNRRLRLPPLVRDLTIDYTGLSFVAPEKVHFRFKLEGQDRDWREVVNQRRVQYSNLPPGNYRFRLTACNNSGVWNEEGASLEFVVPPAWYQTNWFRALCAAIFLALVWAAYQFRVHQLQRVSRQLRDVIDTIPGHVWSALPDGSVDFINRRWLEFSGVSLEEALGRGWEAAVHPDDLARFIDEWRAAVACGKAMETEARVRRADGQYRWLLIRNVPLHDAGGKIVKWYGTSTDIDDRKRAEEALRRSNRELRAMSNCNQILLRASDEQSLLDEICRIVCEEAGYRMAWVAYAEHDAAKSVRPVAWTGAEEGYLANLGITWADTERGCSPAGTAIRSGKTCCIQDFATDPRLEPWRESALQRGFLSGIALPLKDEQANAFGSLSIYSAQPNAFTSEEIRLLEELAADLAFGIVTLRSRAARKRAEESLRESETRFRTFVDHAADAFFVLDIEQGTIIDVNRSACESLGYTWQELIGMTPMAFDVNLDRATLESVAERTAAGESVLFDRHWHRRKDGTLFPVEVHTSQYWYGGRRFLLKVARDISDRLRAEEERERLRQLEAELAHLNRVSTLGELAASIAHEVNQPLSGVVSNGSACLRWLAGEAPNVEEAREAARRIVRDGKRAGEVIARVRALAKRAATPSEKLDLNETIREVLALVGDEAKRMGVMIRAQFADDLSPISGDRVQLQQVVLNLAMNAMEAMSSVDERPRELLITTRNLDADQVQVTVEDSGPGLDPNTLDKIFDPFYTTKPGGMGMGLSISRSILQAHGGRLWATINDGPGTSFHFTLPNYHEE
jgi:PAS domain S-box-containing protein